MENLQHLQQEPLQHLDRYLNIWHIRNTYNSDPTFNIHGFKSDKKLPQSLSDIQVEALLDQPKCRNIKGYRDKAILEVMYATGMRASDIIRLQLKDINLSIGCIYCRGKNKERIIQYTLLREIA